MLVVGSFTVPSIFSRDSSICPMLARSMHNYFNYTFTLRTKPTGISKNFVIHQLPENSATTVTYIRHGCIEHRASVKRFVSLQFLNRKTVGRTPWTGDQPIARPLPTQTQNKRRHACLEWDSNPRS
jgi:hypothetical protein